ADAGAVENKLKKIAHACGSALSGYSGAVGQDKEAVHRVLTSGGNLPETMLHVDNFGRDILGMDLLTKDKDLVKEVMQQVKAALPELQVQLRDIVRHDVGDAAFEKLVASGDFGTSLRELDVDGIVRARDAFFAANGQQPDRPFDEETAKKKK